MVAYVDFAAGFSQEPTLQMRNEGLAIVMDAQSLGVLIGLKSVRCWISPSPRGSVMRLRKAEKESR